MTKGETMRGVIGKTADETFEGVQSLMQEAATELAFEFPLDRRQASGGGARLRTELTRALPLDPRRRCRCEAHLAGDVWHGLVRGYVNHYCRCDACKEAAAIYRKQHTTGLRKLKPRPSGVLPQPAPEQHLTTEQLAQRWGCSPSTLANQRSQGVGPA